MSQLNRLAVLLSGLLLATVALPGAAQTHVTGTLGPGSTYEIDVPAVWNGDLVVYAHGIVQADKPVAPPSTQDGYATFRAALLAGGYAVAASSYSSNGWSLDDAVRRTHQLRGIFRSKVGAAARTYLAGHSMGALAIVKMVEKFPGQYDGALPVCGPLGGGLEEIKYAGDARLTFDFYFPGLLPGNVFYVPPGTVFAPGSPLFNQVLQTLLANPGLTLQWATAAKLPFANGGELINSAMYIVGFGLNYTNDLIERVNGKIPYDNTDTVYAVNVADPVTNAYLSAQLNAGVVRYEADIAALNYYTRNYQPTGDIGVPVVTLHTERDPAIPFRHEDLFAAAVAEAGRSDLLLRRSFNRWGHCAFQPAEIQSAFSDLVGWVTTGVKP